MEILQARILEWLPCPSPGDLSNPGINLSLSYLPHYTQILYHLSHQGSLYIERVSEYSHSVVSDSFWPKELQLTKLPCPTPTPGAYLNSCPLSQWCHQPSHPLSFPSLSPAIFPSIRIFSSESVLRIRWPKYWSFSFSISPSNEYSGLISSRIDWFDLLAVQGTLNSLLQYHSSKASIFWHSAFFIVWLSRPYMTTGKTIALTRWTFVGKVLSLLFNMLSRLAIAYLPRSKSLNFMAAVTVCSDFGAPKKKVSHCFHCFPIYLPWSDGTRCHDLSFFIVEF